MFYQTDNSTKPYNYNFRKNTDYFFPSHIHRDFELAYVENGSCDITVDGKEENLATGGFALILPNCVHSYATAVNSVVLIWVFSKEYVPEFHQITENLKSDTNCFFMNDNEKAVFFSRLSSKEPNTLDISVAMNIACSAFFKEKGEAFKQSVASPPDDLMHKILMHISEHYTDDISLKALASNLGYEEHYLSRCFHKYFSKNFKQFVNELRLSSALQLMKENPKATVTEIAFACGFQSVRNFNRVYKNILDATPRAKK